MKENDVRESAVLRILSDYFESERKAIDFMRAFAGIHLKIPPMAAIECYVRSKKIIETIDREDTPARRERLAQWFGLGRRELAHIVCDRSGLSLAHRPRRDRQP